MKITIESTTLVVEANGIKCRVWQGDTSKGVKVKCLIPLIAAQLGEDLSEFNADLREQGAPWEDFSPFPLRLIL